MIDDYIVSKINIDDLLINKSNLIITFITNEYHLMLLNWYKHLQKLNLENNILVICLDIEAFELVSQYKISCLYIDQEKVVNSSNPNILLVKKAYIEKHHICKAVCLGYFTTKYNINVIHSDIDMIFLKDPFDRLHTMIGDTHDMGAYMDLSYEEFVQQRARESEPGGYGFVLFYVTPRWFPKFISKLKSSPLLIDDNNVGINVIEAHFDNIKCYKINVLLFTSYDIWKVPEFYKKIKDFCYCVHYNTSRNTWMYKMTESIINKRNNTKIERMKEYGHWLL